MWMWLSLVALLFAAVAWIIGDALIVGFAKPDQQRLSGFIAAVGNDSFAYQLPGSERRLFWGALVANFATPLLLAGLYVHYLLFQHSALGLVGVGLLAVGMALSPLAHATFYFLGRTGQRAYAEFQAGKISAATQQQADETYRFLQAAWFPAVASMLVGGVCGALAIVLGQTPLPRWAFLLTPPVLTLPFSMIRLVPYPGRPVLDGAGFNLALLGWAVALAALLASGVAVIDAP